MFTARATHVASLHDFGVYKPSFGFNHLDSVISMIIHILEAFHMRIHAEQMISNDMKLYHLISKDNMLYIYRNNHNN